jgi:hypothetical protein
VYNVLRLKEVAEGIWVSGANHKHAVKRPEGQTTERSAEFAHPFSSSAASPLHRQMPQSQLTPFLTGLPTVLLEVDGDSGAVRIHDQLLSILIRGHGVYIHPWRDHKA